MKTAIEQFTCIVPTYNEAARIGRVLDIASRHPLVREVVVVDDGSNDGSADLARTRGLRTLVLPRNMGKATAVARGLELVHTSHVLLLDADLVGLTTADIDHLLRPVVTGTAIASISLRGNAPLAWRLLGFDYISGERAFPYDLVAKKLPEIENLPRFGLEVYLNELILANGEKIASVRWPGVVSPAKVTKRGTLTGLTDDVRMIADIYRTVGARRCIRQLHGLANRVVTC
ncbi:glycosyltransferase family 2 protein [Pannonibacter sp. Q-1]|uniref:Glycosyl transferase n=1 Tax=Pannonibacter phragmitetus TaxID=121719 RepID=A0A0L0IS21_9HYPH|nr:glycosyltransferase family 2 protein [Pannonibacter phragmitetus]ALV30489.1 glycosyl transferase [Pannonibacter phragmitetus]KND16247.1 glycosyl transferase [Pannonibacter phragmitetus]